MKNCIFIIVSLLTSVLKGQNLIPNPGFDMLLDCPYDYGQITLAASWRNASNGTPDLYNECSPAGFEAPYAGHFFDSYQKPRSGEGYGLIAVYSNSEISAGNSEYMETSLIEPLKKGKTYYIEFFVSPDMTPIGNFGYTDAVGLALSDTFYFKNLGPKEALPLEPVIENRGTVITDTAGWTRIGGCYRARGGEKYALVGNFRNTQETIVKFVNTTYPFINFFYIEDVLIQEFDPLPDTVLLCDGVSQTFNAQFLDATYRWNTGSTDSLITIQNPGLYTVEAILKNCVLRDTVLVLSSGEIGGFPADTLICQGESLLLKAPVSGEYLWMDGSTDPIKNINQPGTYTLSVTNACGSFTFSTNVAVKDCGCNVYVPNAISPNSSGLNSELRVFFGCDYPYRIIRFSVYDRWGNNIYNSFGETENNWKGTYKGNVVPIGVYTWFLEYEVVQRDLVKISIESGTVSVLK